MKFNIDGETYKIPNGFIIWPVVIILLWIGG